MILNIGQYHCCRCPGSLCCQGISNHNIDSVSKDTRKSSCHFWMDESCKMQTHLSYISLNISQLKRLTASKNGMQSIITVDFHMVIIAEPGLQRWLSMWQMMPCFRGLNRICTNLKRQGHCHNCWCPGSCFAQPSACYYLWPIRAVGYCHALCRLSVLPVQTLIML